MNSSGQAPGSATSSTMMKPKGPPYPPKVWALGGAPNKKVDIPITSVFLVLFIASAVTHMTIFQINNRKHKRKFLMSALLFGFSMARVMACILRIASVSIPHNVSLAIAANIFVAAGVVILFVINIIFTQRIVRAAHPSLGWHKAFEAAVKILIALVIIMIIMLITVVIQSFFTLNPRILRIDRDIQLTGLTYFAFVSFVPIPVVLISTLSPRSHPIDKFGTGRWRTKLYVLLTASVLVCLGASYRAGLQFLTPRPMTQPIYPAMHKAAFYIVNFTIEIIVLYMYAVVRVDKRFHIPDGARNSYLPPSEWKDPEHKLAEEDESRAPSIAGGPMISNSANASKTITVPPSRSSKEPTTFKFPSAPSTTSQDHNEEGTSDQRDTSEDTIEGEKKLRSRPSSHLGHVRIESGDMSDDLPAMVAEMAVAAKANAEADLAASEKPKEVV